MEEESSRLRNLIPLVRERDEDAAKELVEILYPIVIRIVRAHLPFATDEEDLSQDIFMKVFTKIEQYRGIQEFTHWVSRIAVNTCYDQLRAQRASRELRFADLTAPQAEFLAMALTDSPSDGPATTAGTPGITGELVERLLASLKPTEQIVIRMLDLEQKSVAEIANLTGWGASKIKVTAMRARRKLRVKLEHLEHLEKTRP